MEQIVEEDFPKKFPQAIPGALECLRSQDQHVVIAGLQILYQVIKYFECVGPDPCLALPRQHPHWGLPGLLHPPAFCPSACVLWIVAGSASPRTRRSC